MAPGDVSYKVHYTASIDRLNDAEAVKSHGYVISENVNAVATKELVVTGKSFVGTVYVVVEAINEESNPKKSVLSTVESYPVTDAATTPPVPVDATSVLSGHQGATVAWTLPEMDSSNKQKDGTPLISAKVSFKIYYVVSPGGVAPTDANTVMSHSSKEEDIVVNAGTNADSSDSQFIKSISWETPLTTGKKVYIVVEAINDTDNTKKTSSAIITLTLKSIITGTFTYSDLEVAVGNSSASDTPVWKNILEAAQTVEYSIARKDSDSLPDGISINTEDGIVRVTTATMLDASDIYTVTAAGTGNYKGFQTVELTINIVPAVMTLAGSGSRGNIDGESGSAMFYYPKGIAVDTAGTLYVADTSNHRIRKIALDGGVSTFAGSTSGFGDAKGTAAQFNKPRGIAVDAGGTLYVADIVNHRIRKITPEGEVSTLAGSGVIGFQDGAGTSALFSSPKGIAVDANGMLYVADTSNHRIRKITPEGVVSTLAGSTSQGGFKDGKGTVARFNKPHDIAMGTNGMLYVADNLNHRIRKIVTKPQNNK